MKKPKESFRRIALLLALALVFGLVPGAAFAADSDYTYAEIEYYSKLSKDYVPAGCYYTDSWFDGDAAERSDALALASAQLAAAGADGEHASAFLTALGFGELAAVNFDSQANDCAFTMGTKTVPGKTLVAVVFQGDQYGDKGWQQNVTINADGGQAAEQVSYAAAAETFLAAYDELAPAGDVILWMTGQSRGGAIANLAAACLLDRADAPEVFCYTFESPATTESTSAHDSKYSSIHNYVSDDDPVTMLPPWGMTRYGQDIVYNTAAAEEVIEEIAKINPDAYEQAQAYDADAFEGGVKAVLADLLGQLEAIVPAREAYSEPHAVSFENEGEEFSFTYTYQEGLQALCHLIFGSEGTITSKLMPLMNYLEHLTYSRVEEVYALEKAPENSAELLADAARLRWETAGALTDDPATQKGFYALLTFLSPLVIRTDAVEEDGWELPPFDEEWVEGYGVYLGLDPFLEIADNSLTLVFSHHPDVIIARLSLLAPAPAMEDVALTVAEPAAGDAADLAPSVLEDSVAALGLSWLVCKEAKWLTNDETLQDGKLYSLQLTISPVGHTVPEDLGVTLNGQEPKEFSVSYEGGPALITGVWTFPLGEVEPVTVTFDTNGHGESPDAWTVDKGVLLKSTGQEPEDPGIVKEGTASWRFDGWFDENGTPWEEITADGDVTLYASWTQVIDEIVLTYKIPRVGDSGDAILKLTAPEGVFYSIMDGEDDLYVLDEHWADADRISTRGTHYLSFKIRAFDGVSFLGEENEYGEEVFAGSLTVNGEELDSIWISPYENEDTGEAYIYITKDFAFDPLPRKEKASKPEPAEPEPAEPEEPAEPSEPAETKRFVDVPDGAYFEKAVYWALEKDITAGTDGTHFSPDLLCPREQALTMLRLATGLDASQTVISGTVTRAEIITFLYQAAGQPAEGDCPFVDVPEDAAYYDAVRWAFHAGVTAGTDETHFSPDALCTRAQFVTFLYLALGQN